jgi:DNA gyrase subunit A
VVTARIVEARGELIGALMVGLDDEVFAITSAGGVIRTTAAEIKQSGRQTMGVRLVNLAAGQTLVAIARNAEEPESESEAESEAEDSLGGDVTGDAVSELTSTVANELSGDESADPAATDDSE